jgi:hypothetical protein
MKKRGATCRNSFALGIILFSGEAGLPKIRVSSGKGITQQPFSIIRKLIAAGTLLLFASLLSFTLAGTNRALNFPDSANASSVNAGNTAAKAVDGDTSTRWESNPTDNEWWSVDLGQVYPIDSIQIEWPAAMPTGFQIKGSNAKNFDPSEILKDVSGTLNNSNHLTTVIKFSGKSYQYIGFQGGGRQDLTKGYSFYEFRVFSDSCLAPTSSNPVDQSVAVGGTATFSIIPGGGGAYTFQWSSNNGGSVWTDLLGATASTLSFTAASSQNGYKYKCVVNNSCGFTPDTSAAASLAVFIPGKAFFTVSDSITKVLAPIQFSDKSTGNFTKRLWYFGDGKVDSSNAVSPLHSYEISNTFTAKLVLLNNTLRVDSMIRVIKTFNNYWLPITVPPPYADSVRLYYKSGSIPITASAATPSAAYSVAEMKAKITLFKDTVAIVLAASDSLCGFMTQVHWYNGATWSWSAFNQVNGALVSMKDPSAFVNSAIASASHIAGETVILYARNLKSIDTTVVDSFALWFGLSETDSVPNFNNPAQTRWFNLGDRYAIINANNGTDSTLITNPLFATDKQITLFCAVILKGKNDKLSKYKVTPYQIGTIKPDNLVALQAIALGRSKIQLLWNQVADVTAVRIWYRTGSAVPVNFSAFTSPPFDSIHVSSATDTQVVVKGLNPQTHYYFGAQILKNGQWSNVTVGSSTDVATLLTGGILDSNTVQITSINYDSLKNVFRVGWKVEYKPSDSLDIGISYSTGGYPSIDTSVHQWVRASAGIGDTVITLREPVNFNTAYYFSLWERKYNGAWTPPTNSSIIIDTSSNFNWQSVLYFTKEPGDTNRVFNGNILLITDSVSSDQVVHATNKILLFDTLSASFTGFIPVSIPFYFFSKTEASSRFRLLVKYGTLPDKFKAADVRIYQWNGDTWLVDRTTKLDVAGYVSIITNDLQYPFMALIDTQRVSVVRTLHKDTIEQWTDVPDTVYLSDNSGNAYWRYSYAKGGDDFTDAFMRHDTLKTNRDTIRVTIPSTCVSPDNGLRGIIAVDDGVHYDTINVSRQVVRNNSDYVETEVNKWVPLKVTAGLDKKNISAAIKSVPVDQPFSYDPKKLRLFRWLPSIQDTVGVTPRWVEYSDAQAGNFAMDPGMLVWIKSKENTTVDFGRGVTTSLRESFSITLPGKNFTDFALPFKFNMRVGDIIDFTGKGADTLQFYSWKQDLATGRYTTQALYLKEFSSQNVADKKALVGYLFGYSVFNPGASPITLRIPPIPETMSKYSAAAKQSAPLGWSVAVNATLSDGSDIGPVFCGYSPANGEKVSYFPVPPSFSQVYAGVFDNEGKKTYGHALSHTCNGGCSYLLTFVNQSDRDQTITCRFASSASLPPGFALNVVDPALGEGGDASKGTTISVPAGATECRWLLAGTTQYLAKTATVIRAGKLRFSSIYPNPFGSLVRIRYSAPPMGVESVSFGIYDMRGKLLWQHSITDQGARGEREIIWNGRANDNRRVAAGIYLVRMTAFDARGKNIAVFEKKMTRMP